MIFGDLTFTDPLLDHQRLAHCGATAILDICHGLKEWVSSKLSSLHDLWWALRGHGVAPEDIWISHAVLIVDILRNLRGQVGWSDVPTVRERGRHHWSVNLLILQSRSVIISFLKRWPVNVNSVPHHILFFKSYFLSAVSRLDCWLKHRGFRWGKNTSIWFKCVINVLFGLNEVVHNVVESSLLGADSVSCNLVGVLARGGYSLRALS